MARNIAITTFFLSLCLISLCIVGVPPIRAQYNQQQSISPPLGTPPITLSIISPQNNTIYSSTIAVNFTVSFTGDISRSLYFVNFTDDWQTNSTYAYKQNVEDPTFPNSITYYSTFNDIPTGNHSIVIYAFGGGGFEDPNNSLIWDYYSVQNSRVVNFSVDPSLRPSLSPTPTPTSLSTSTVSPSPTATTNIPEFPLMAIPMLLFLLSFAGILVLRKKRRGKQ